MIRIVSVQTLALLKSCDAVHGRERTLTGTNEPFMRFNSPHATALATVLAAGSKSQACSHDLGMR
jgi:hypothetical protein